MASPGETQPRDLRTRSEFRRRRRLVTRLAALFGVFVAAAIGVAALRHGEEWMPLLALTVSFAGALWVHLRLWRCPACNGHLGKLYLGLHEPRFCRNCGVRLLGEAGTG